MFRAMSHSREDNNGPPPSKKKTRGKVPKNLIPETPSVENVVLEVYRVEEDLELTRTIVLTLMKNRAPHWAQMLLTFMLFMLETKGQK